MSNVNTTSTATPGQSIASGGAYRPSNWVGSSMVSVTATPVAPPHTSTVDAEGTPTLSMAPTANTTYVFDAVLELDHEQRLEKTRHPVQTGADISSHAYLMPARLTLTVGMSDAMASYAASTVNATATRNAIITPWVGTSTSKSVNAYQTMLGLQASRALLTVVTRLRTYSNMIITSISPREDHRTIAGLRMRVEFEEILTGSVSTIPINSARTDATGTSGVGQVNPTPVPTSTQSQFQVPQAQATTLQDSSAYQLPSNGTPDYLANIPGAGSYSSVPGQTGPAQ